MSLSSLSITSTARFKTSETTSLRFQLTESCDRERRRCWWESATMSGRGSALAWTPTGQPNSTFWPPNAILLAALLLAPRKRWWAIFLASASGPHVRSTRNECRCGPLSGVHHQQQRSINRSLLHYSTSLIPQKGSTACAGSRISRLGALFAPLAPHSRCGCRGYNGMGRTYWQLGCSDFGPMH